MNNMTKQETIKILEGDCTENICLNCAGIVAMPPTFFPEDPGIDHTLMDSSFLKAIPLPDDSPTNWYSCSDPSGYMNLKFIAGNFLNATDLSGNHTGFYINFTTSKINECGNWGRYRIFGIKKKDNVLRYTVGNNNTYFYDFEKVLLKYGDYAGASPFSQSFVVKNIFRYTSSKVKFSVNLKQQIADEIFNVNTDSITVSADFNNFDPYLNTLTKVGNEPIFEGEFNFTGSVFQRVNYYYNIVTPSYDVYREYKNNKFIKRSFWLSDEISNIELPTVCFDNICSGQPDTSYVFKEWNSIKLDSSSYFSVFAPKTGKVQVWGQASDPILDQNTINANVTGVPNDASGINFVQAGKYNVFAVNNSGKAFAWGDNSKCLNNIPIALNNTKVLKVVGCDHAAIALKEDLRITGWGCGTEYNQWNGWTGVIDQLKNTSIIDIEAGNGFLLALTMSGNVVCWGINSFSNNLYNKCIEKMPQPYSILNSGGLNGNYLAISGLNNIKRVVGGNEFVVGISGDNYKLFGWGSGVQSGSISYYKSNTSIPMPELNGVTYVSAGDFNAHAITSNKTLYIWGNSGENPTSNPFAYGQYLIKWPNKNVYASAPGLKHSLALRLDNNNCKLIRWGEGSGINTNDSITGIYNEKNIDCLYKNGKYKAAIAYLDRSSIYWYKKTGVNYNSVQMNLIPYLYTINSNNELVTEPISNLEGSITVYQYSTGVNPCGNKVSTFNNLNNNISIGLCTITGLSGTNYCYPSTYIIKNNLLLNGNPLDLIVYKNPIDTDNMCGVF